MIGCVVMGFASAIVLGFIALLTVMLLDPQRGGPDRPSRAIKIGTRIILITSLPVGALLVFVSTCTASQVAAFTSDGLAVGMLLLFASAAFTEASFHGEKSHQSQQM